MSPKILVLSSLLAVSAPAFARQPVPCPCEAERTQLVAFRDRIANAESPEAAREMALSQTRLGHKAIKQAARLVSNDPGIAEADARLSAFEEGVNAAQTQEQVAAQFDQVIAQHTGMNCAYTTVEVVVIIIGFLLGILPGILFLFLFC